MLRSHQMGTAKYVVKYRATPWEIGMKVVLFAGGRGSRLAEETASIPNPVVEVSGKAFCYNLYFVGNDSSVAVQNGDVALWPNQPVNWNVSVVEFIEKVVKHETWINGGFFVFGPEALDYLSGDEEPLEQEPLAALARDGELFADKHTGFRHPIDTVRDRDHLSQLCVSGSIPWMQMPHPRAVEPPPQAIATHA